MMKQFNLIGVFLMILVVLPAGMGYELSGDVKEVDRAQVVNAREDLAYYEVGVGGEIVLDERLSFVVIEVYPYKFWSWSGLKRLFSGRNIGSAKVLFKNKGEMSRSSANARTYTGQSSTTLRFDQDIEIAGHTVQLVNVDTGKILVGVKSVPNLKGSVSGRSKPEQVRNEPVSLNPSEGQVYTGVTLKDRCGIRKQDCIVVGPTPQGSLKRFLNR